MSQLMSRRWIAVACTTFLCAMASPAVAWADGFDLQQFHPMPNLSGNLYSTASADVAPHLEWSAIAFFDYAHNPLILSDEDGNQLEALVSDQATMHLMVSLGLFDRLDVGVDLPLSVWQDGTSVPGGDIRPGDGAFGIGDVRFVPKVQLYSTRKHPLDNGVAIALLADVYAPTGDASQLQGGDFRIGPRLAVDMLVSGTRLAANIGYQYRDEQKIQNLSVRDTLSWNLGAEIPINEMFRVTTEAFGRITPGADSFKSYNSPTELLLGGKYQKGRVFATLGGGLGLVDGYGTPDFRLFAGVGMAPPHPTREPEPVVIAPPPEPEPEPECTAENVASACPDVSAPECIDGALRTHHATCTAEGTCAYESSDAPCGDGTYCGQNDAGEAACLAEPDCTEHEECTQIPAPTCVDNVLTQYIGRCLEETCQYDPSETTCPERYECGLSNGIPDCVPVVDQVKVTDEKIEIMDMVYFAVNSDEIKERSYDLLRQVAQTLKNNTQIELVRIEGHTDSSGSKSHNQDLSERRAKSVRTFLMNQGIDGDRLTSQGYGPDRPIETNNTAEGRAANRRVEFHIVRQK